MITSNVYVCIHIYKVNIYIYTYIRKVPNFVILDRVFMQGKGVEALPVSFLRKKIGTKTVVFHPRVNWWVC